MKKILIWPNDTLRNKSEHVTAEFCKSPEFTELVTDLKETLDHYHGVGLSAIQIGVPKRVFVMRTGGDIEVFVNPIVMHAELEPVLMDEGCLSLPGVYEKVLRSPQIILTATDPETWEGALWDLEGVEAQCAQHEIEHFDGVTMADKMGVTKRQIARRTIEKTMLRDPAYD
jgi:peptide deformylase